MQRDWTIEDARTDSVLSARAGFSFLFSFGITWILASVASYFVAPKVAAWIYLLQGVVAMPAALLLPKVLGYPKAAADNPLTPLALQLVFIQPVAFPAFLLVMELREHFVPAAFAAVVGAHFLPFSWMHKTNVYTILGIIVSVGAFAIAVMFGARSLQYTGFFVGAALLVGAVLVRRHALALERARGA